MLEVRSLSKEFVLHMQGGLVVPALRDVSFSVARGEFLGLAGPSGAGKSTILKCIHRTYLATSGAILYRSPSLGEIDLASASEADVIRLRRNEIGMVSQFLRVIPRVSTLELVAEPLRHRQGLSSEEATERAVALLSMLRIPKTLWTAFPATFSGGEQQRVNIARAVGWVPPLLLLDEPTASLDRTSAGIVLELLSDLRSRGCTMIGIFHDPEFMARIADRTIHLEAAA